MVKNMRKKTEKICVLESLVRIFKDEKGKEHYELTRPAETKGAEWYEDKNQEFKNKYKDLPESEQRGFTEAQREQIFEIIKPCENSKLHYARGCLIKELSNIAFCRRFAL